MSKKKSRKHVPMDADATLKVVEAWLKENSEHAPDAVVFALTQYVTLSAKLSESKSKLSSFIVQLRRALGITPSSEKKGASSARRKPKKPTVDNLLATLGNHDRLRKWHQKQARKHSRKSKKIEERLKSLEEIELTEEENAEIEKEHQEYLGRMNSGDGRVDPELESPEEALMTGVNPAVNTQEVEVKVAEEKINGLKVIDRIDEHRTRFDFKIEVTKFDIAVEKLVVKGADGEKTIITASTDEFGPERYGVTWGFLASLSIMASQYAIPFNRLANMLSSHEKVFKASQFSDYFRFVAKRLVPIYLQLFKQLSASDVLVGDDTSCRVTEIKKYLATVQKEKESQKPISPPPWLDYDSRESSERSFQSGKDSLGVLVGRLLEFASPLRRGTGVKTSIQTTVVSGRSDPMDPSSGIVFYRSHFGGCGDIFEQILRHRPQELKTLWIQSDLATKNLISDPDLTKSIDISYAGCASHARRPFVIFEQDDPDDCAYMLHLFQGIYICEDGLDLYGRNYENVSAIRGVDEKKAWDEILDLAKRMSARWPPKSELGQACAYIIKNFEKLTAYLRNPRLCPDNNFSERALRLEKMIQASSLFRTSLEGRFALDIVRTVAQTAVLAGVDVREYIEMAIQLDPEILEASPELFTPHAYAEKLEY